MNYDTFLNELPIQFFKIIFNKEKLYFNINHICEDLLKIFDYLIQFFITQKIKININLNEDLAKLGCLLERLIIGLFETNKLLKNLNIIQQNIIRIDEIYNENNIEKKEKIKDNYLFLIKQNKEVK